MKPMRLELQAFSAYATKQVVDFRHLGTQTLMMISGKTGAGKTALLDAISYALFGESSGGDRPESSVRSHHAKEGVLTYVDYRFETQSNTYRVVRYPQQKKKSGGQVELWRVGSADDEEGELVASGKRDVSKEIKMLLGYTVDQFRSVVMLPQGQFRRFLSAKTDDKAKLLSTLFHTERYRRLQEVLNRRALDLKDAQSKIHDGIAHCLNVARVDSENSLIEGITEIKKQLTELAPALKVLEGGVQGAQDALRRAHMILEQMKEQAALRTAQEQHRAKADEMQAVRKTVQAARMAAQLQGQASELAARRTESQQAKLVLEDARTKSQAKQNMHRDALEALEQERARDSERTAASHRAQKLSDLLPLLGTLKELETSVLTHDDALDELKKAQNASDTDILGIDDRITEVKAVLETARESANELAQAELSVETAKHMLRRAQERIHCLATLEELDTRLIALKEQQDACAIQIAEARARHAELYETHLSCYAAQLAIRLVDDVPCPVCGGLDHPAPATSDQDDPGKDAVQAAVRMVDEAIKAEEKIVSDHRSTKEAQAKTAAELDIIGEALGSFADKTHGEIKAHLEKQQVRLDTLQVASKALATHQSALERLQEKRQTTEAHRRATAQKIGQMETDRAVLKARLKERRNQLPADVRSTSQLESMIAEAAAHHDTLAKRYAEVEALEKSALAARMQAQTEVQERTRAFTQSQELVERTILSFENALNHAGFIDEAEYASARRTEAEVDHLVQSITDFDEESARMDGRLEQLDKTLAGIEAPPMEALQAAEREATEALNTALETKTHLRETLSPMEQATQRIAALRTESADREREFGLVTTLSRVANGEQPNAFKLKFDRYILAGLLDEVLLHANHRLHGMSDGRYQMQRKDPSRKRRTEYKHDRRSQAGLALEVIDSYTGKERDAESLSGGEGFQASLSLALGLADVVQRQAGGVELNAMFIDEGFGTQSPDALDSVLDTLTGLQSTGRLIGFISHVEELKDRIPAQLHVHKSSTGSRVELRVR